MLFLGIKYHKVAALFPWKCNFSTSKTKFLSEYLLNWKLYCLISAFILSASIWLDAGLIENRTSTGSRSASHRKKRAGPQYMKHGHWDDLWCAIHTHSPNRFYSNQHVSLHTNHTSNDSRIGQIEADSSGPPTAQHPFGHAHVRLQCQYW